MPKVCEMYYKDIENMNAQKAKMVRGAYQHKLNTSLRFSSMHKINKMTRQDRINLAEAALWNWNSVEGNLLIACVLVNCFGIMFEAEYVDKGTVAYEVLGNLVIAVVSISIIYYFLVVWSEVIVKIAPQLSFSFGRRNKSTDASDDVELSEVGGDKKNKSQDRQSVFEINSNPLMAQMALQQEEAAGGGSLRDSVEIMTPEEAIELKRTLEQLREENKGLKKQVAVAGAQKQYAKKKVQKKKKEINLAPQLDEDEDDGL